MNLLHNLWNDESGQGLTEYALIIAIVSVALVGLLIAFREAIGAVFTRATAALAAA